jgi:hypothetical protein
MAVGAKVGSFDALRAFRAALYKFAETCDTALTDADGEMQRVMGWLERDQQTYWQFQMRKRQEDVMRCKEAVRMKKLFKSADGRPGSAVDEEKALVVAMRRLARGEQKFKAVMSHSRKLPKEILLYKGQVQRLATALQSDVPTAGAQLSRIVAMLEAYAAVSAPSGAGGPGSGKLVTSAVGSDLSMSRGGADAVGDRSQWAHLRSRTPDGPARDKASSSPAVAQFRAARLATAELEALLAVSTDRELADPQAKVIVAKEIGSASRIYLQRTDIAFPGDSGWYIGRADDAPAEAGGALSLADLLSARADLTDIMTLPRGFLAVLDGGGLVAVLGPRDEELWKPAAAVAQTPPAEAAAPASAADAAPTENAPAAPQPEPAQSPG